MHWYEDDATRWRAESYEWFYRDYYVTYLGQKCPGLPVYAGLGNHDSEWTIYDLACALVLDDDKDDLCDTKRRLWHNFPNTGIIFDFDVTTKHGSLAYSWNIGNYHFVQGHNLELEGKLALPGGFLCPPKWLDGMVVPSPVNWVKSDVAQATADGKKIVLCHHGPSFGSIRDELDWTNVVAVFRGHFDSTHGTGLVKWVEDSHGNNITNGLGNSIPIFQAGHSGNYWSRGWYTDHQMIIAEFADDYMNVGLVDCGDWAGAGGVPEWLLDWAHAPTNITLISLSVSTNPIPEFRMECLPAVFLVATLLIVVLIPRKIRSVKIDR
jgi:hypothetical protein